MLGDILVTWSRFFGLQHAAAVEVGDVFSVFNGIFGGSGGVEAAIERGWDVTEQDLGVKS